MIDIQNKKTVFTVIHLIVPIIFLIWFCIACTNEDNLKSAKILVIHSFKNNNVAYPDMNRRIVEDLQSKGIAPEMQIFYLNCDALSAKQEEDAFYQYLDTMTMQPDIILTTDDQATYSLMACKHPLVPKVPVVFTGVNFPNWELLKQYPNVTGIWDRVDYLANVEMIEKLMGYQRIRFYYDKTFIGRKILGELKEQLGNKDEELNDMIEEYLQSPDSVRLMKVIPWTISGEGEKLKSELKSSQFYFQNLCDDWGANILWYINGTFENFVALLTRYDYSISRIGNMSTIPTFSAVSKEFGYGQGILGGYFMTQEEIVEEACDYIAQILKGSPVSALPVKEGQKSSVLDWTQMERWGIDKSTVEKDFQIINMPFYVEYRTELIIGCMLFGALIIFVICYLLFLFKRESNRKKQAQQNLWQEKEFLSLVLDGGNIYTWSYEYADELFIFDKEFATSIGMYSERISLKDLVQIIHPDDVETAINQFIDVVNQKEDKATVCARLDFSGKGYVWYEFRILGLPRRGNGKVAAIGSILSVQKFKEHEEELIIARDLAAKTELKQSFLANMSHEIRTPLNAIVGFSNILVAEDDIDEEEKRDYITAINTNCELLLKLINDILEISRIESGNMSFSFAPCSVNKLVEDVYQMNVLIVPSSISFIKETLAEDITLTTDCARLKQVLVNFVNNALKFTSSGHIKVGVECYNDTNEICIYVEDTGIGISKEEQRMIFERFYKCDQFSQGTGLGLSISSVIAGKLKGRIILESEENAGSRFGIVIPCEMKEQEEDVEDIEYVVEETDTSLSETDRPVVLIAEDSASNYMVLSRILKKDFNIVWALNGQDALDVVNKQKVDLVLMDIRMQEMDGITALKKIRRTHKNLPVIIQSAYAYDENREQAKKAGCSDFIEKPIHADILMDAIGKCMIKLKKIKYIE